MADWPYPFWIAHRGAGKLAPENTMAAFRTGAGFGYRGFECDVKLSRDGMLFLLHDSTLERTTSGAGQAGALDWNELSQLDAGSWHSRLHAGESIPRFEAIARWCSRNSFALNIEIKPNPGQALATGRAVAIEAARLWAGQRALPLLTSFEPDALQAALEAEPSLPRGLLLDALYDGWLDRAQALSCVAVVTDHLLMDAARLAQIHAAGMRALVYTVNDAAEAERLIALGIDGLITDAVDRFSPAA